MPWQIIILLQNLLAAFFAIYSRNIAKRFNRATMPLNLMMYAFIALSGFSYALIRGLNTISIHSFVHFLPFFIFAGLCFAITNMLSYVVFQYVDAALNHPTLSASPLTPEQLAGSLLE
jgi:hypothetical protein